MVATCQNVVHDLRGHVVKRIHFNPNFAVLLIFIACCKDDDNNPATPNTEEPPELTIQSLCLPPSMAQSFDPHVQTVAFYMQMANIFNTSLAGYVYTPECGGHTRMVKSTRAVCGVDAAILK